MYRYQMPTEILFGFNSFDRIIDFVTSDSKRKVLLITGKASFSNSILNKRFIKQLESVGATVDIYSGLTKSDTETLTSAINITRKFNPSIIISIGGGAVLDIGKVCACLHTNKGKVGTYLNGGSTIGKKPTFMIAVPTTAGTGSEVSPFVVIWDMKLKKKISLDSKFLYPAVAVIDPILTLSLPAYYTACTGMDALTQAIEAYWSKAQNPISDAFALRAISLIIDNIKRSVKNGKDKVARDNMAKGALFSGLAFSNTKTTICHSLSYPMTIHFNIVHGQAVAVTLPLFLNYNYLSIPKEKRYLLLQSLGAINLDDAINILNKTMKGIGLKTRLSELRINKNNLNIIIDQGYAPERVRNAPKIPSKSELRKLLTSIL